MESFKKSLTDFVEAEYFAIHMLALISFQDILLGVPKINLQVSTMQCRRSNFIWCTRNLGNVNQYEGGDHLIFIGQIANNAKVNHWYSTQESIGLTSRISTLIHHNHDQSGRE